MTVSLHGILENPGFFVFVECGQAMMLSNPPDTAEIDDERLASWCTLAKLGFQNPDSGFQRIRKGTPSILCHGMHLWIQVRRGSGLQKMLGSLILAPAAFDSEA
eukprot:1917567-Amphidinium_carterae.1